MDLVKKIKELKKEIEHYTSMDHETITEDEVEEYVGLLYELMWAREELDCP